MPAGKLEDSVGGCQHQSVEQGAKGPTTA
jgi:hypothetical protein